MELYVFFVATTAILIVLGKGAYAVHYYMTRSAKEHGLIWPFIAPLTEPVFWARTLSFAADFAISTFIAAGVRLFVVGRVGAAVTGTIGIIISLWIAALAYTYEK